MGPWIRRMGRRHRAFRFSAALLLLLAGCATPTVTRADLRYMVMFDGEGEAVDPLDTFAGHYFAYEQLDAGEHAARVEAIIDAVKASGKPRVVIFIHGGLNNQPESIQRVLDLHRDILADGAYPIFVNWQSNLLSSYRDRLLFIRRGQDWESWGVVLAPFYLVADVATGIFQFPMVAWSQLMESLEVAELADFPDRRHADDALQSLGRDPTAPLFQLSPKKVSSAKAEGHWLRWCATLVFKPFSILAVETAGTGSWDVMLRRIDLLFQRDRDFEGQQVEQSATGLLRLMARLHDLQAETGIQVDLVGHSMGTIVLNRLLFQEQLGEHAAAAAAARGGNPPAPDEPVPVALPRFRNIVYLAAACSIRDYERCAVPYLLHDHDASMYHVVLHPSAELAEANLWDVAPRGSLLVWIDDFLARPASQVERTAGRSDNLLPTLYMEPDPVRDRVHVFVLPLGDEDFPQRHGDFSDPGATHGKFRFWREACWYPAGAP